MIHSALTSLSKPPYLRPMFPIADRDTLDRQIERLLKVADETPSILSVYLNVGTEFAETNHASSSLSQILQRSRQTVLSSDWPSSSTDALLTEIGESAKLRDLIVSHRGRGVVLFESTHLEEHTRLAVPTAVWDIAVAGRRPYIRPLATARESLRNVVAIIVESRRASLIFDVLNRPTRSEIHGDYPRKSNRGGWYGLDERRNQERARKERITLLDEVNERLKFSYGTAALDAIYVFGQRPITNELVTRSHVSFRPIMHQVGADTHTVTEARIIDMVTSRDEATRETEAQTVWTSIVREGAPQRHAVAGTRATAWAVNRGAVEHLMINGTDPSAGWECPKCWGIHLESGNCETCGTDLVDTFDLLDSMTHEVLAAGGRVTQLFVPDTPRLRVAASLRF